MSDAPDDIDRPDHDRFSGDWLSLREPADHEARNESLEQQLVESLSDLPGHRPEPWRIVDLGAGAGSNPRHLAPRLPGAQRWRLVDHDPDLLGRAAERLHDLRHPGGFALSFDTALGSLAELETAIPGETDLVTASALIDLVSSDWLEALAERASAIGARVLIVLSVDGDWRFVRGRADPAADRIDRSMLEQYRKHQARAKGLGPALGGAAPAALARALESRGYRVETAPSPWRLAPGDRPQLARTLLDGWRRALLESPEADPDAVECWAAERDRALAEGRLGVEVGHLDLLGIPVPPGHAP